MHFDIFLAKFSPLFLLSFLFFSFDPFDLSNQRSLVRDPRMEQEREQALKLIRSFLNVPGGHRFIPNNIISCLIAIADTPEDKMYSICVETLCELVLFLPEQVVHLGGLKSVTSLLKLFVGRANTSNNKFLFSLLSRFLRF